MGDRRPPSNRFHDWVRRVVVQLSLEWSNMNAMSGLGFLVVVAFVVTTASQFVRYKYFDEYLLHMERTQQSILIQEIEVKVAEPLPLRTGYRHNKDEKCCMLGHLAGEKGFHCVARFYAARIIYRNYNRAHNKKISALLKGKPDPTAEKLMRTFEQCVAHRGNIFHKCCRHAAFKSV